MDDLGMDYEIIENLNLNLSKIWQLKVAVDNWCKRFISSRVIRGSALVEMSYFWLQRVRLEPKMKVLSYPFYEKPSE